MEKQNNQPKKPIDWVRLSFYLAIFFAFNSFYIMAILSSGYFQHHFWWYVGMILLDIWWLRRMWLRDTENR